MKQDILGIEMTNNEDNKIEDKKPEEYKPTRNEKGHWVKGTSGNQHGPFNAGVVLLKRLSTEALPELFDKAMEMIRDPSVKAADRINMIIHLFDRAAGKAVSVIDVKDSTDKGMPAMSMEQLNKMIHGLSNVIEEANKSSVIEGSVEDKE